jgi:GntR family transcriptional regulator
MPTPDEAPPGVPVFRVLRTVYDTDGRPLEVQDSVAAADRHRFRYEVEMR